MAEVKRMQTTPLFGRELELVRGILMDVIAAAHIKNPTESSTELSVATHFEKGDLLHLGRALKKL